MRLTAAVLAVEDIETSRRFYEEVLGQKVIMDLGKNVAFDGGFALQEDYLRLVGREDLLLRTRPNDHELYFEEDDFDAFLARLAGFPEVELLHDAREYPWGQRVVRFYDPDFHIVEVGESMGRVIRRLRDQGMDVRAIVEKTMHPEAFVRRHLG